MYESASETFSNLSDAVVEKYENIYVQNETETNSLFKPLKTMDVFAGCGGLSHGLVSITIKGILTTRPWRTRLFLTLKSQD